MKKFLLSLIIGFTILCFSSAWAVTYINNTSTTQKYTLNGKIMGPSFAAGETRAVQYYTDNTNLTKTLDTPYANRVLAITDVTSLSGTDTDVPIDLKTDYIIIIKITGSVNAYIQDSANTPAELKAWTSDDPIIIIPAKGRFNNLALTGSGNCSVYQYDDIE